MSEIDISQLPRRHWAHPFDHAQPGESQTRGHDASPDAIDGYYGVSWLQAFRDHRDGKLYAVQCFDGTNRSKGTHSPEDKKWMQRVQDEIVRDTKQQSRFVTDEIVLSSQEWALMSGRTFCDWFDLLPGEQYKTVGDEHRYKLEGYVGTINGVRVIVDPYCDSFDELPPSDLVKTIHVEEERNAREDAEWGHLDDHVHRGMRTRTGQRVRGPQWAKHMPNRRETTDLPRRRSA